MVSPNDLLTAVANEEEVREAEPTLYFPLLGHSVEVVVPIQALLRAVPSEMLQEASEDTPGAFSYAAARRVDEDMLVLARFLLVGNWFAAVAICRQLLELVILDQEQSHAVRAWREAGSNGPAPQEPAPLFDADRAGLLSDRLAEAKAAYDYTSEALHGRGQLVALWLAEVDSPAWYQATDLIQDALGVISEVGIGRAQLAVRLSASGSPVAEYVRQRGRGPVWHFHPVPELVATTFTAMGSGEWTERLAAALPEFVREEDRFFGAVRRGEADPAGHIDALMLRLLRHGAYRADRFQLGLHLHSAASMDMSGFNGEVTGALRCALLAKAVARGLPVGHHATALATAGAALEASTYLWADESDYLFTAAHRVVEQTARARQWREDAARAAAIEEQPRRRQRWTQRRYAAFIPLLVYMDSFVHAYLGDRRADSRRALVKSFGLDASEEPAPGETGLGNRGRTQSQRLAHIALAQELFATLAGAFPGYDARATEECLQATESDLQAMLDRLRNEVGRNRAALLRESSVGDASPPPQPT